MTKYKNYFYRVLVPSTSVTALSPQVITLCSIFGVILHLHGTADLGFSYLLERLVASTLANLPLFLFVWLAHTIFRKESPQKVGVVLSSYVLGGLARGLALSWLLELMNVENKLDFIGRLLTSAMAMSVALAIATHFFTMFKSQRQAVAQLNSESQKLSQTLEKLEIEGQSSTLKQVSTVANQIVGELRSLRYSPVESQIKQIQKIINDFVRPLSKMYASEIPAFEPRTESEMKARARFNLSSINLVSNLPTPWAAVSICISAFPSAFAIFGLMPAIRVVLFGILAIVPSTYLAFEIAKRTIPKVKGILAYLLLLSIFTVFSIPGALSSYVALVDTFDPLFYFNAGLVTFPLLAMFLAVAGALFEDYDRQKNNLQMVNRDLQWAIARVNLLAWVNRGEFARLLHGPIQNSLHATLIRLKNAKPETVVDSVIEDLQQRISTAADASHIARLSPDTIRETLENVAELWQGIAQINFDANFETLLALSQDSAASSIVFDLCNEVCSNAIRHGQASVVQISITSDPKHIRVKVTENGSTPKADIKLGVGSQLLMACSTTWETQITEQGRQLKVAIPSTWMIDMQPAI